MADNIRLEQAKALGFDSIESMEDHQLWLDSQKANKQEWIAAVSKAEQAGSNVIDIR
ncbi:hypothetical protein AB6D66_01150 [Vibrio pomeroyi]|uniref:Uncharacterized protein n=1 Tax=Vibrio pomeroyi TaxID=198832 RepID=A0ABV4MR88_9VIBR|nr:hypothetical protein [Vibrio atlanticus]MCZ4310269.1 hypothetical protein [Vibrio atlanticus]